MSSRLAMLTAVKRMQMCHQQDLPGQLLENAESIAQCSSIKNMCICTAWTQPGVNAYTTMPIKQQFMHFGACCICW